MPQVSLIIPVYNGEYKDGIESALHQTYENLEIIVVNHTNKTNFDILTEQNRVKCIHSTIPEEGMAQALQEARGKYVFYLEERHALEADCIETLVASAEQYGSDIVLTHFKTYNENDGLFYFHESGLSTGELQSDDIATLLSSSHRGRIYLEHPFGKLFAKDWLVKRQVSVFNNFLESYGYEEAKLSYVHKVNYLYREEKQELVSVIVPVYNVEDYLPHCLNSIVNQTYPNLEILLINDGSTDRSGEICEDYAQRDGRIRVIHQENGGQSVARNTGLDQMTGDYVTFVDSDDAIDRDFISNSYACIIKYDVNIVMTNYYRFRQETGEFLFHNLTFEDAMRFLSQKELLDNIEETLFTMSCTKLFSKSIFDTIRFPEGRVFEDSYIAHKCYLLSNKVLLLNQNLYMYRIRSGSTTAGGFNIKNAVCGLENIEERLVDYLLSAKDTSMIRSSYINHLHKVKSELEEHGLCNRNEYLRIINKINSIK